VDPVIDTASELRSLRKTDPAGALVLADESLRRWPDEVEIRNAVSWIYLDCIFSTISSTTEDAEIHRCLALLNVMASWTPSGAYSTSDATAQCAVTVAKSLNGCGRAAQALDALDLLRPEDITDKPSKKFASLRSRWYVERTRSLELLRRWEELIACCDDAFTNSTIGRHSVEKVRLRIEKAKVQFDEA